MNVLQRVLHTDGKRLADADGECRDLNANPYIDTPVSRPATTPESLQTDSFIAERESASRDLYANPYTSPGIQKKSIKGAHPFLCSKFDATIDCELRNPYVEDDGAAIRADAEDRPVVEVEELIVNPYR